MEPWMFDKGKISNDHHLYHVHVPSLNLVFSKSEHHFCAPGVFFSLTNLRCSQHYITGLHFLRRQRNSSTSFIKKYQTIQLLNLSFKFLDGSLCHLLSSQCSSESCLQRLQLFQHHFQYNKLSLNLTINVEEIQEQHLSYCI